jgi:CRISPR-associated endonuclease/helicase Cas3
MTNRKDESFEGLFHAATGFPAPFPYQKALAQGDWPDLLQVPTGLGKTAAVGLTWIHRRLREDPETPRRLVYCLPMRVLVEQTGEVFQGWLDRLGALASPGEGGPGRFSVNVLMGGEEELRQAPWARYPEENAVLIGTQDMLLSRALMRGYGMSRFQWPVHFALLHSDAFWVFDEVQIMGPALATSAQLEAFRRRRPLGRPSRSLWLSATLHPDWLGTVDFRPHAGALMSVGIGEEDRTRVPERLGAVKRLQRADLTLNREGAKSQAAGYVRALGDRVRELHVEGSQTVVILNRVDRAQALAATLRKGGSDQDADVLLVHARFRAAERTGIQRALREEPGPAGRIVVATQAIEAGVDISSRVLVTELAPWDSMVQRFGRCNRYGEHANGADVYWVDIPAEADEAAPYHEAELQGARDILEGLEEVGPSALPPVTAKRDLGMVLRWRDLVDLFDIDPDLSGFDLDVSPYIRAPGSPQVRVFWRAFDEAPTDVSAPERAELCPVSLGQMKRYLEKKVKDRKRPYWEWDFLEGRWRRGGAGRPVLPGSTLLLRASDGGYDPALGFAPEDRNPVPPIKESGGTSPPSNTDDPRSRIGCFVRLEDHVEHVMHAAIDLAGRLDIPARDRDALVTAARWHDVGKAHPAFQTALLDASEEGEADLTGVLWAKSSGGARLRYRIEQDGTEQLRPHFRHELASMLAWLEHAPTEAGKNLVAYLIAAHHGKVRMGLRALPTEPTPDDDRLHARGVWDGDRLPPVRLDGTAIPETPLRLDVMRLGWGEMGPSWTERTRALLEEHGPFRLAWLEALLRVADWRASALEEAHK